MQGLKYSLLEKYKRVREQTNKIVTSLEAEDFVAQPIIDVSPPKWHLGHTTWFFETFILSKYHSSYRLFDESFPFIFNSYYESQGKRILRNKRGTLTRPSTQRIKEYRSYVDEQMEKLFSGIDEIESSFIQFFEIGLNHEQQHQELLITDIKYILGSNPLLPIFKEFKEFENSPITKEWLSIEAGNYLIGYDGKEFCFDNEKGVHQVFIHDFQCMNRLVTNSEFIEFIEDGGYQRAELWLSEGWDWVKINQAKAPFYWFKENEEWSSYQLNGVKKINRDQTVTHINFYEADAFARWKKCRLLTEFEWEIAAKKLGNPEQAHFQELEIYQPQLATDKQFFGSAWEWTNSAYLPYPFYKQEEGALGEYNGKFMVNQMVLRGGSCATPKDHFRLSYRNFFHPHLQWQFTGIRLARNI